ncbi:MAG: NAD kinase [Bacteroidetes bacterium]|nr:MAG: NAD kinase [Bacteroidota bacterium]
MRIAIFGKTFDKSQLGYLKLFIEELEARKTELCFYEPYFESLKNSLELPKGVCFYRTHQQLRNHADMMFSIGGDGTMLDTLPYVRDSGIPILGINLGRLGFLSSIPKDEIKEAIDNVWNNNYFLEQRTLIQLVKPDNLFGELDFALNDLTVYRTNSDSLLTVHVYLDNKFLNTYWGDGLIVSTPTGSTAYSLSVGGPIVTPGSQNFVIAPIASHNLTVRPIVIQDSNEIKIRVEGRETKYQLTMDSRQSILDMSDEIIIKKCDFKVNLVQMYDKDFYATIREKLLWGKDVRN